MPSLQKTGNEGWAQLRYRMRRYGEQNITLKHGLPVVWWQLFAIDLTPWTPKVPIPLGIFFG